MRKWRSRSIPSWKSVKMRKTPSWSSVTSSNPKIKTSKSSLRTTSRQLLKLTSTKTGTRNSKIYSLATKTNPFHSTTDLPIIVNLININLLITLHPFPNASSSSAKRCLKFVDRISVRFVIKWLKNVWDARYAGSYIVKNARVVWRKDAAGNRRT